MPTIKLFKEDFYERIGGLKIFRGLKVLDVGCGDGEDALAISKFAKNVVGLDIINHKNWGEIKSKKLRLVVGRAEKLPFKSSSFDALFLKDVLHHVDDIEKTMKEIKRVTSENSRIVIIEGNRYNPIFYIHMTKILGHEHLTQRKFKALIKNYFPSAHFIHFESHFIPFVNASIFKKIIFLEKLIDKVHFLKPLLSYNGAVISMYNSKR